MEKLNALGSSLPPEQPPTDQAIASLNADLSQEFKIAANAVTKLYRVANERNSLLKHHGYLNCLDDMLNFLQQSSDITADDIHFWCLKQKNDILSHKAHIGSNPKLDFNFDNSTDNCSSEMSVPKFTLSRPPLSVEHHYSHGHGKSKKLRSSTVKKQQTQILQQNQHDTWKPIGKYMSQRTGPEESQTEEPLIGSPRSYVDSSRVSSATKKQKASTSPQNTVRRIKK
ncbi:hypothetical protein HG535_0G00210 [Zygotorulaspora mrakii]|uniref:Uncharacterized protein n=1 Tax=Zygotorulaspora mrakii TaxID=42260 RepID=A0A7H9B717_ZYGMR|nr:uncharacterized protein HG535_0G00210 [Zygotorulaspora mrakii]QLG74136.1 hypothetical protein HG535_0G00210 [Zygotorulaspora mrakii]